MTIFVTGASSGLGRATAIEIARHGGRVVAAGRDVARLNETLALMPTQRHEALAIDLSDAEETSSAVADIAGKLGPFDGVFHAAGSSLVLAAKLTKSKHVEEVFGASVNGALGIAKAASRKGVVRDGASLVFMSSVSSLRGRAGMVVYSAAKAAVDGMVRALAAELAPRTIRVNSIVSGAVATAMHDDFVDSVSDELVRNYRNLHMLGFGEPSDIANAAMFLLGDGARWVTGASLAIDGGYTAK